MSNSNASLNESKRKKDDLFFTRYEDVEKEIEVYIKKDPDIFRGKVILCPCDNPFVSNFTKYFTDNFDRLGIERMISTCYRYNDEDRGMYQCVSRTDDKPVVETHYLLGDGDFASEEVSRIRDEADFIITNPPFSLWGSFFDWCVEAGKDYILIANINAFTLKNVYPYFRAGKVRIGVHEPQTFIRPDGSLFTLGRCSWLSSVDYEQSRKPLVLKTMAENLAQNERLKKTLTGKYGKLEYPHYDEFDAIECPLSNAVPSDYVPCWYDCPFVEACNYAKQEGRVGSSPYCKTQFVNAERRPCNGVIGVPTSFAFFKDDRFEYVNAQHYKYKQSRNADGGLISPSAWGRSTDSFSSEQQCIIHAHINSSKQEVFIRVAIRRRDKNDKSGGLR